jgi:hypothetical protein
MRACLVLLVGLVCRTAAQADDFVRSGQVGERAIVIPCIAGAKVTIDGRIEEEAWAQAVRADGFFFVPGKTAAARQTFALLFHDRQNLYVAFTCEDPEPEKTVSKKRERDDRRTWLDDCVEVMISPDNNPAEFYHFMITVVGARYDARMEDVKWNADPDWQAACSMGKGRWFAEVAFPLAAFGKDRPPRRGTVWGLKLLREDKAHGDKQAEINSSWTHHETPAFDSPAAFGQLVFEDRNMLVNGGMEADANNDNVPDGWDNIWGLAKTDEKQKKEAAQIEASLDRGDKAEGQASARFARKVEGGYFGVLQQAVNVRAGRTYRLSARVKIEGLTARTGGAYINLSGAGGKEEFKIPPTATGWNEYTIDFNPTQDSSAAISFVLWKSLCTVWVDDVRFEEVGRGLAPGEVCLTGNHAGADAARANVNTGGTYSYYEYATDQECFPEGDVAARGKIPMAEGKLTGGKPGALVWGGKDDAYLTFRVRGHDVEFDLGKDYLITRVQVTPCGTNLTGASVYLRPSSRRKFYLACDRQGSKDAPAGYTEFNAIEASARYVRVNVRHATAGQTGLQQVRIYGKADIPKASETAKPVIAASLKTTGEAAPDLGLLLAPRPEVPIYPLPVEAAFGKGRLTLTEMPVVLHGGDDTSRTGRTVRAFAADAAWLLGLPLATRHNDALKDAQAVVISPAAQPSADAFAKAVKLAEQARGLKDEGYVLRVDATGGAVAGKDAAGLFYGLQTVLQLLGRDEQGRWFLPEVSVRDWPQFPFRIIFHNGRLTGDWEQRRVRGHAHLKFNCAQGAFDFVRANDAEAMCRFADDRLYQIIPSLSMTPGPCFFDAGSILKWTERDQVFECYPGETYDDLKKKTQGSRVNFCPSNPRSWEGLRHIWKTHGEKYNSAYISVGTDEMYQTQNGARWNACNLCKARNLTDGELLLDAMQKTNEELKALGKKSAWMSTLYGISNAADKNSLSWPFEQLPKDGLYITYFSRASARLHELGYRQIGGTTSFIELKPDAPIHGTVVWNWGSDAENALAAGGQLLGYVAQAEQNWAAFSGKPALFSPEFYRRTKWGMGVFRRFLKGFTYPSETPGVKTYAPLDLSGHFTEGMSDPKAADDSGWLGLGPECDLSAFPTGEVKVGDIPFRVAAGEKNCILLEGHGVADRTLPGSARGIPVGKKLDSIVFLHAVNDASDNNYMRVTNLAGLYLIRYADGAYVRADMRVGTNVHEWTRNFGADPQRATWNAILYEAECAWVGKTKSGKVVSVWAYEWPNPYPEKEIESFDLCAPWKKTHLKPVLIAATGVKAAVFAPGQVLQAESPLRRYTPAVADEAIPGKRIELGGGTLDPSGKTYTAPDGTTIKASEVSGIVRRESSSLLALLGDDNQRWSASSPATLTVSFPAPRSLTAVRIVGILEFDRYPGAQCVTGVVEVPAEADAWQTVGSFEQYSGDEGPRVFPLSGAPVRGVRVRFTDKPSGLSSLQVFAKD